MGIPLKSIMLPHLMDIYLPWHQNCQIGHADTYTPGRPVILHQHGLFDSSDAMVCHGPDLSPAYYLANAGYDVWLANQRGNKYALNHVSLDTTQDQFWNFSISSAMNDSQANIEYVRNYTSSNRIIYTAHSLGNAGLLVALTRDNDWYRDRISLFVALAPISHVYHTTSPVLQFFRNSRVILLSLRKIGIDYLFTEGALQNPLFYATCRMSPSICQLTELLASEAEPLLDDQDSVDAYFRIFPSSSSLTNVEHFTQLVISGRFQDFDYGPERNMIAYGTPDPPEYNLTNINGIPVAIFYGTSDEISEPSDVQWLIDQLGDNVVYTQSYEYGHISYYTAINMTYLEDLNNLATQYISNNAAATSS